MSFIWHKMMALRDLNVVRDLFRVSFKIKLTFFILTSTLFSALAFNKLSTLKFVGLLFPPLYAWSEVTSHL
jgi:hypothetical protein